MYFFNSDNIKNVKVDFEYKLFRNISSEELFWISIGGFTAWAIALLIYVVNYF